MSRQPGALCAIVLACASLAGCGGGDAPVAETPHRAPLGAASAANAMELVAIDSDPASVTGQVYRLYRAAFDRPAEAAGLGFHLSGTRNEGTTLRQIAANFTRSPEFSDRYAGRDPAGVVTGFYANVLKRGATADEIAYHVKRFADGADVADVLLGFSESPENKDATDATVRAGVPHVVYGAASSPCGGPAGFDGVAFESVHPIGEKPYACRVVPAPAFPALEGATSVRIELRPGDCSANAGFDDCANDRSRVEMITRDRPPADGRVVTYEAAVFIPPQAGFKPQGDSRLFLGQVNATSATVFATLAFLEYEADGHLYLRTQKGFTSELNQRYLVAADAQGRWIRLRYELKATPDAAAGYLRVHADGRLVAHEQRATAPDAGSNVNFRVGLYNGNRHLATQPFTAQVVYFDAFAAR